MTPSPEDGASFDLTPDEAFTLLGNETRIEILRALWDAHDPYAEEDALSFSELYDRVGLEDTGNFNYHLGQLVGHFVTESEAGYELATPGFRIVRAIIAGTPTGNPTIPPTPVDATCPRCDGQIQLSHEKGITWARCTDCEGFWAARSGGVVGFALPPNGVRGRTVDEVLDATIVYSLHRARTLSEGVCPDCGGTVDSSLQVCEQHDAGDGVCGHCGSAFLGIINYVCESCKLAFRTPSWDRIQNHPALVAFYHDHGIEHVHTDSWAAMVRGFGWHEELLSRDPPRLRVTVPLEGDEFRVTLDEEGEIVEIDG